MYCCLLFIAGYAISRISIHDLSLNVTSKRDIMILGKFNLIQCLSPKERPCFDMVFLLRFFEMRNAPESFYKSSQWKTCREQYLDKSNHLCERCLAKGLYVPARFVHHKIHLNFSNVSDPNIALNFNNLESLCFDCHNNEHFEKKQRRWKFENGKVESVGD